jgi:ZIP family zinc transporter
MLERVCGPSAEACAIPNNVDVEMMKYEAKPTPVEAIRRLDEASLQRLRQLLAERQAEHISDAKWLRVLQGVTIAFILAILGLILAFVLGVIFPTGGKWDLSGPSQASIWTTREEGLGVLLTFSAWLSTTAGGALIVFECFVPATNPRDGVRGSWVLPAGLAFAGGIMMTISLGEILGKAEEEFGMWEGKREILGGGAKACKFSTREVKLITIGFMLGGGVLMLAFHYLVHFVESMAKRKAAVVEAEELDEAATLKKRAQQLMLMSVISMVAILIHNAPEGIITYYGTIADVNVGVSLAIGIIVHNFPEGFLVSLPFFFSLVNLKRAAFDKNDTELLNKYSDYLKYKDEETTTGKVQVNGNGLEESVAQQLAIDGYLLTDKNVLMGLHPKERLYACLFSAISALSEPIAGCIANGVSKGQLEPETNGILFGVVAGMMIAVVVYELFPIIAKEDPDFNVSHHGFVFGSLVMLVSIMLMAGTDIDMSTACKV